MDRDSHNDSIQEMEQIRKGLENFLYQEVLKPVNQEDTKEEDMKDRYQSGREPQFFTIGEVEEEEKELDIIGMQDGKKPVGARRHVQEDYLEDWDNPTRRKNIIAEKSNTSEHQSRQGKKISKIKDNQEERSRRSKKKRKKRKSRLKKFLITVAMLAVLLGVGGYYLVGQLYAKMNFQEIESVASEPIKEDGVVNILLIGSDSRGEGDGGRSDAMILLSISDKTRTIYMTSLLRDMYVEIPGYKGNRLNAAYSLGGPELLMETIELNFDITVNRYAVVNFEAFANLVDAVGGIELELSSEEIEYVNGYLVEYNMLMERPQGTDNMDTSVSGLVQLNGAQALAYSRNRYLGTDFGRTERQRKVLTAVIQKAPKALVTNAKELMDGLLPNLTTNVTQTEVMKLGLMVPKALTYEIVQSSIPLEGTYQNATIRDMAVLEVDFEANKQYLQENIYGR